MVLAWGNGGKGERARSVYEMVKHKHPGEDLGPLTKGGRALAPALSAVRDAPRAHGWLRGHTVTKHNLGGHQLTNHSQIRICLPT